MRPAANPRRAAAHAAMIGDAKANGARGYAGCEATGEGNFFFPTALAHVPLDADAMNHGPFGPVALMRPFATEDEALEQANRLPYGLVAFAFTENGSRNNRIADNLERGMVGNNSLEQKRVV